MLSTTNEYEYDGYTFKIKETKYIIYDKPYSYSLVIGGTYENCVNLSYKFKDGIPIEASLPILSYEPECVLNSNLPKGSGTISMIKALLTYGHNIINNINIFKFDDNSRIDCNEKDMIKPPPRKLGKPLNLAYFSIIYSNMTWYEKHFNAKMIDTERYTKYRKSLSFLTDPKMKVSFINFLEITQLPSEFIPIIQPLYESSETYHSFFNKIPFNKRCNILFSWLNTFVEHYIGHIYTDKDWYIDINDMMNHNLERQGGGQQKRKTRRRSSSKYYITFSKKTQNF